MPLGKYEVYPKKWTTKKSEYDINQKGYKRWKNLQKKKKQYRKVIQIFKQSYQIKCCIQKKQAIKEYESGKSANQIFAAERQM